MAILLIGTDFCSFTRNFSVYILRGNYFEHSSCNFKQGKVIHFLIMNHNLYPFLYTNRILMIIFQISSLRHRVLKIANDFNIWYLLLRSQKVNNCCTYIENKTIRQYISLKHNISEELSQSGILTDLLSLFPNSVPNT